MRKNEEMQRLREELASIAASERDTPTKYPVCEPGTNLVWGEGDADSSLVLVGEAPGAQEDRLGRPFVGAAGQLLDQELQLAGIPRDGVYITNIVKCRPTVYVEGRKTNRSPTAREVATWRDVLMRELEIISPAVILCLGAVAASVLIHPGFAMKAERGQWFDGPLGMRVMATFHPAFLLRAQQYGDRQSLLLFRQDLNAVAEEARARRRAA